MTDLQIDRMPVTQTPPPLQYWPAPAAIGVSARLAVVALLLMVLAACNLDLRGGAITRPFYTGSPPDAVETGPALTVQGIEFAPQKFAEAQDGETVRIIAQRLQLDPDQLATLNSLEVDQPLDSGRIVLLPRETRPGGPVEITEFAELAIKKVETATGNSGVAAASSRRHVVRQGDSISSISSLYGVSNQDILDANDLLGSPRLVVGQVLDIPDATAARAPSRVVRSNGMVAEPLPSPPSRAEPLPEPLPVAELPRSPALQDYRTAQSESEFRMPVNGEIVRAYTGKGGNEGIDIAAPEGTEVYAAGDGEVALISRNLDETAILLLRHGNNMFTVYANLKDVDLQTGAAVTRGQPVGKIAGGDKQFLHFEIRLGTESTDPVPYIS